MAWLSCAASVCTAGSKCTLCVMQRCNTPVEGGLGLACGAAGALRGCWHGCVCKWLHGTYPARKGPCLWIAQSPLIPYNSAPTRCAVEAKHTKDPGMGVAGEGWVLLAGAWYPLAEFP